MQVPWRVAIIDGEPQAAARLRGILLADPAMALVGTATDGPGARVLLRAARPDILFLSPDTAGADGIGALTELPEDEVPVLVVVAREERASLPLFDRRAVDFLLKPVTDARVRLAVARAKAAAQDRRTDLNRILKAMDRLRSEQESLREMIPRNGPVRAERLLVRVDGRTVVIPVDDIDWIESAANYVKLHVGDRVLLHRQTLSALADELDPASFARIHRTMIVNLDRMQEIEPWFSGDGMVVLKNGTKLRMSRSYRRVVEGRLVERR